MSDLAVPLRPDNLRLPLSMRQHLVTGDVFNICDRVKEVDPRLFIYALERPVVLRGKVNRWAIGEVCLDGVERFVMYVSELDARIIEELQKMLRIPFEKRLAAAEQEEAKHEAEHRANELDKLAERVALPMYRDLEQTGFIQRPRSYAKRGIRH